MTNEQTTTVVLKDATGSYFLVPQETLEQGRVPAEHVAEMEQIIAAGGSEDDTQGLFFPLVPFLPIFANPLTVAGGLAGYFGTKAGIEGSGEGGTMTNAQYVEQLTGRPFPR